MIKFTFFVFGLIAMSYTASCRLAEVPPVEGSTREVRDDLGRTVVVAEKIERAISLAPNITEMIFAIGAGDKLVGVTTYCNYPAEATAIEKVGDTQSPNIERIIALKPQVVFVSTSSQLESFSKTLNEQGIAVYVTSAAKLDDVYRDLQQLGELFEKRDTAESVVWSMVGRVSAVRAMADHHPGDPGRVQRPRVFFQISKEPLFTIGKDSFLTDLVELAGGVSVTKDVATAYPKLSKETALALDPEVILLSDSEDNHEPSEVFRNSSAVKNGQVYKINPDIISRPGPRLVDALEEIANDLRSTN